MLLFHLSTQMHWGTFCKRWGSIASVKTFPIQPELGKDEETMEMLDVDRARCQGRPAWNWKGIVS